MTAHYSYYIFTRKRITHCSLTTKTLQITRFKFFNQNPHQLNWRKNNGIPSLRLSILSLTQALP